MSTRPNRETAYRVFAAEFEDADFSYAESDEERAPNYVVTPTGARINRLFAVGVLTEIETVSGEQLRARIVDPTGAFVVYAGQYQPDALSFLERAEPPAFVAVTGKARTFQPEDSNRVFTSIRPETLSEVDAATRDRFVVTAAERTIERVRTMRDALSGDQRGDELRETLEAEGVEPGLAAGIPRAIDHYDTTPAYLDAIREVALGAARVVAGEREEVPSLNVAPGEGGAADRTTETQTGVESAAESSAETAVEATETAGDAEQAIETTPEGDSGTVDAGTDSNAETTETDEPRVAESTAEPEMTVEEDTEREPSEAADETDRLMTGDEEETDETATDLDPEEFELDAEERERIEDEYGTDFESAAEVDGPGEADIETPVPEEVDADEEPGSTATPVTDESTDPDTDEATETPEITGETNDNEADTEPDEIGKSDEDEPESDPETAAVAAMRELDDGDGADREAIIEWAVEHRGLTREAAADGIQEALMSGECYESDDNTFTPI